MTRYQITIQFLKVVEELGMPEIVKLYKSGLRRSPQLAENKSRRSVLTTLFCFGEMLMNPTETIQSTAMLALTKGAIRSLSVRRCQPKL